ncbi:MAG: nucleotidyl transferase AbiEii/AbiGii toxin family protein [Gammaproteobacteria bacterium]|nr:nucleotidyl transferase AbiEii/AbiGii toxin family protein [Gammaproteobacteria bacterium]
MISPDYRAQVDLLLRVLPYVAKEACFALKGGTAINLFERELPRLSVDIDLTYLPVVNRETDLSGISESLGRIRQEISKALPDIKVVLMPQSDGQEAKLSCAGYGAQIKIEVNTTMRGHLQALRLMQVADAVQNEFGLFAAINVLSQGELYGGKICAALDRQHPRDLFDIHQLFENEGITEDIKQGFIAALVGSNRPINEMLRPNFQDQRAAFETQFEGMTSEPFSYEAFEATRIQLVDQIHDLLTDDDRKFLVSFKEGEPDWRLYPLAGLEDLPAVKWKLQNINKLLNDNPAKHSEQLSALTTCLGIK